MKHKKSFLNQTSDKLIISNFINLAALNAAKKTKNKKIRPL